MCSYEMHMNVLKGLGIMLGALFILNTDRKKTFFQCIAISLSKNIRYLLKLNDKQNTMPPFKSIRPGASVTPVLLVLKWLRAFFLVF